MSKNTKKTNFNIDISKLDQLPSTKEVVKEQPKKQGTSKKKESTKISKKATDLVKVINRLESGLLDRLKVHLIIKKTHPDRDTLLNELLSNYLKNYKVGTKSNFKLPIPKDKPKKAGPSAKVPHDWIRFGYKLSQKIIDDVEVHLIENKTHPNRDMILFELISKFLNKHKS